MNSTENPRKPTTEGNLLITVLRQLPSSDSFFAKALLAVIRRLHNQRFLFVIGIIALVVAALAIVYLLAPEIPGPFYAALGVTLVLTLVALGDHFLRSLPPDVLSKLPSPRVQESSMANISEDCKSIQQELENARTALHHLRRRAALLPPSQRPTSLDTDIEYQEKLVNQLQGELDECLKRRQQHDRS